MMAPIVQFNVMRTWSTEHGAGQVAAVLFEIEVPAPGVGLEVRPTQPDTGDRRMELINRELQLGLLNRLGESYPRPVALDAIRDLGDIHQISINAYYLEDHGLIEARWTRTGDPTAPFTHAKILTAGVDFLADDGGLTAILGTITIKLHQDTLRALMIDRVLAEHADEGVKARMVNQLKALPAEAIGRLAEKALDASLRTMPNVLQWLQTTLVQSA